MALCNTRSALEVVTAKVRYIPSGSLTSHRINCLSSLSEKTRKSNHLQMLWQRQHFLLSYLKTLSVGPAGVWTTHFEPTTSRTVVRHSTNWANRSAVPTFVWGQVVCGQNARIFFTITEVVFTPYSSFISHRLFIVTTHSHYTRFNTQP